jgi:hypothetical protein
LGLSVIPKDQIKIVGEPVDFSKKQLPPCTFKATTLFRREETKVESNNLQTSASLVDSNPVSSSKSLRQLNQEEEAPAYKSLFDYEANHQYRIALIEERKASEEEKKEA